MQKVTISPQKFNKYLAKLGHAVLMEEFLLKGVTVRKLDDELQVGASWDNCKLIARQHAMVCSLQLKFGKPVV